MLGGGVGGGWGSSLACGLGGGWWDSGAVRGWIKMNRDEISPLWLSAMKKTQGRHCSQGRNAIAIKTCRQIDELNS